MRCHDHEHHSNDDGCTDLLVPILTKLVVLAEQELEVNVFGQPFEVDNLYHNASVDKRH